MEDKEKLAIFSMFLCLLICLELNSVLAWDWDNVKSYDTQKQEVTITNALGLGDEIAKIQLKTPLVNYVVPGKDRLVAEVDFNVADLSYQDALKSMTYTNMKTGKDIDRVIKYKYKNKIGETSIPQYTTTCKETYLNGSVKCTQTISGYITNSIYEWIPLEKADFSEMKEKTFTIGLFTEVYSGDYIDWKPTWYGIKIDDWAVWSDSLSAGLVSYYKLNETTGTDVFDSRGKDLAYGMRNLTFAGTNTWVAAKIANGAKVDGINTFATGTAAINGTYGTGDFAIVGWVNAASMKTGGVFALYDSAYNYRAIFTSGGYFRVFWAGSDSGNAGGVMVPGNWQMYSIIRQSGQILVYRNTTLVANTTGTTNIPSYYFRIGSDGAGDDDFNGTIDEVGVWNRSLSGDEISSLYNVGAGLTYAPTVDNPPIASLNSPASANYTSSQTLSFNCTGYDETEVKNVTLWINGIANTTQAGSGTNYTALVSSKTLGNGRYLYNCTARDNNNGFDNSSTNIIFVDNQKPNVTLISPFNGYNSSAQNVTITFQASDLISGLNTCWFNLDYGTNLSTLCGKNVSSVYADQGNHKLNFFVNDSLGNTNYSSANFTVYNISYSFNFASTIPTGENEIFYLNVSAYNIASITASLTYNATSYAFTTISNNGTYAAMQADLTTPYVIAPTLKEFNMTFTINGAITSSSNYSQIITTFAPLNITPGGGCDGNLSLLFNMFDEINFTSLNGTFEYNFYYGLSNSTIARNYGKITSSYNFSVCINGTNSPYYTLGYGEVLYYTEGYSHRSHYFFDGTNITLIPNNIDLYTLKSASSTTFLITAQTVSLQPYVGYYVGLLRWYPSLNSYKMVDMGKTDDKGQTLLQVKTEDTDYKFALYDHFGNLVQLSSSLKLICQTTPCVYTLYIDPTPLDLTTFTNIQSSLTFNSTTKIFTFIWNDPSQVTQTINLTVYKDTGTTSEIVCSSTSTGYTGTVICNVSAYTGFLRATATRTASPETYLKQLSVWVRDTFISAGGRILGLVGGALIMIMFAFAGIASPVLVVIMAVVSLIPLVLLGNLSWAAFTAIGVIAGLILHSLGRTRG